MGPVCSKPNSNFVKCLSLVVLLTHHTCFITTVANNTNVQVHDALLLITWICMWGLFPFVELIKIRGSYNMLYQTNGINDKREPSFPWVSKSLVWWCRFSFFRVFAKRGSSFRNCVTNPLQVRRVSLVDGQADDLGHFIWMVWPALNTHGERQSEEACLPERMYCRRGWSLQPNMEEICIGQSQFTFAGS